MIDRRHWFRNTGLGVAAATLSKAGFFAAQAAEPIQRSGGPRFRLALAAYSLRKRFATMKGRAQKDPGPPQDAVVAASDAAIWPMSMTAFLDYCVSLDLDGAELTSYFFPFASDGFPSDAYLLGVRRDAFVRGLSICGTAIGNNFTVADPLKLADEVAKAKTWIDKAVTLGAPHIRFFAGKASDVSDHPERLKQAGIALQDCLDYAAERGIMLGVENHGGLNADQMLDILGNVSSPAIGMNLDTGNFVSKDPYEELRRCAKYAVNVQVKTMMRKPDGTRYPADLNQIAAILRESNYQGYVVLEYEEEAPLDHIPAALEALRSALRG
ncbi:MAG: sugar phosphate isomerase/epimerase family protein [Planctomycetota bacterium]